MTENNTLVAGTAIGGHDAEIKQAIERAMRHPDDPVSTWRIGVKNEDGVVYRIVALNSLNQWLDFVQDAEQMGLVDELEDAMDLVQGFDSILRPGHLKAKA